VTQIATLLSTLEDPFQMFPLEQVAKTLAESVADSEEHLVRRTGWWGSGLKYRTVEEEHEIEGSFLLIGSAFVLGQTAITQAVAIARKVRDLAGKPSWLPSRREDILCTEASINRNTDVSEMVLVDAVANYFKHHHEWPSRWNQQPPHRNQHPQGPHRRTIYLVCRLGLSPEAYNNLEVAVQRLGFGAPGVGSLGGRIQDWRERLAESLRRSLCDHDLR
jgi:hypothetical protein